MEIRKRLNPPRGLLRRFAKQEPSKIFDTTQAATLADDTFNTIADEMYEQKEAHWAKRQIELEERLKFFAARKRDLTTHKEAIETVAKDPRRQPKLSEEMQLVLELSKAELKESQQTLQLERYKAAKLEEQTESWRRRCEQLEKNNRSLIAMLGERDLLVSTLSSEMQSLKNYAERLGADAKLADLIRGIDLVLSKVVIKDFDIGDEGKTGPPAKTASRPEPQGVVKQLAELTQQKNRRIKELEDELELRNTEISERRLDKHNQQIIEINRKTEDQLAEKTLLIKRQHSELVALRAQVRDLSGDYQDISGKYVKHVTQRQHEQLAEEAEFEDLKMTRDTYEGLLAKVEGRLKANIEELEVDLKASRARVLELIDEKAALDNELFNTRNEKKAQQSQIDAKERKTAELMVSLQDLKQEASLAKADKDRAVEKMREAQKTSDNYAEQIVSLKENVLALRTCTADLEHSKNMLENEVNILKRELDAAKTASQERRDQPAHVLDSSIQQAIRQLSSIILSKDRVAHDSGIKTLVRNAFGEDFIHLVSTYENKLREDQDAKEKAEDARVAELKKQLSCLSRLQESDEALATLLKDLEEGEVMLSPDELATRTAEVRGRIKATEMQIQSIKQTASAMFDPIRNSLGQIPGIEVEDLRQKVSSQAVEIASLKQAVRQSHGSQRSSTEVLKPDKERLRLAGENEMLKQELSKAMTSLEELSDIVGKLQSTANTDDMALFLQCSASVIEEMIYEQAVDDDHDIEDLLRD